MACPDSSAFFVQRVRAADSDDVFEYTVMIVRGDRCRYEELDLTSGVLQLSPGWIELERK